MLPRKSRSARKPIFRPNLVQLECRDVPAILYVDLTPGMANTQFTPSGGDQTPVAGLTLGTNLFTTIGAAVTASSANDTINVADGTFAEQVAANKAGLIIQGNQFLSDGRDLTRGTETIVDDTANAGRSPFFVTASDVQIAGFTVQGQTNVNQFGAGIVLGAGTAGSEVRNNVIQNNVVGLFLANNSGTNQTVVERNLIRNNNQPGAAGGSGIYTDQFVAGGALTNALIQDNAFTGNVSSDGVSGTAINLSSTTNGSQTALTIQRNTFDGNGRALLAFNLVNSSFTQNEITDSQFVGSADLRLFEGVNNLTISNNTLSNDGVRNVRGLRVSNIGTGASNATNVTFTNNSISGYGGTTFEGATEDDAAIDLDAGQYTGPFIAERNFYGSPTGPTTPNNPGGTGEEIDDPNNQVDFSPFLSSGTDSEPGTPGFQPVANAPTGEAVQGTAVNDTLVVTATGPNSGSYSLNGGAAVPFTGITSFSFAGLGSNDTFRIINPAGGLFAPSNGIFVDGGTQTGTPGDRLEILGGAHTTETHTFAPTGANGHNGSIALVNGATTANYTYTGLEPVLVNAGTPTDIVFNLPPGDGNNQAILEDNASAADNMSQIRSQNGTFETTVFVNPTGSLTVNYGNDGESVTVSQLDPAFAPTLALALNGGTGGDRLFVNFASGNVIPVNGINFNGAAGADGILLLPGYSATNIAYALNMDAMSGNINVDGRLVTFTGQDSAIGVFDQLTAANRAFTFDGNNNIATLNTGFAANDGFSRIATAPDTSLLVDFRNPTTSATVNLGNGNDTITVPGFDAVGAPTMATFNGQGGDDTFNITASTTTAYTVDGAETGEVAGDTLNYDAAGGTVSRTPGTGESGTLTAPGFQPFTFANIETVNITNAVPTISIDDVTMAEGNAGTTAFVFTVRLSTTSTQTIVVNYTTQDGSATNADGDYIPNAGTVTFAPGQTAQTITVLVNGDTKFEPATENFFVNLGPASGGFTFSDAQGQGTITNDDVQPTISINDVSMAEGNAGTTAFAFTVTLSNASFQPVTVNYLTFDGSATVADGDYAANTGTLTFAPGTLTQTITVLVNGDTKLEPTEQFGINLNTATNATIADNTGQGTIVNDDVQPTISINDVTMVEGNAGTTAFVFTVTLTNASATPITVAFTTADNSATVADNDYVANAGTLTFAPGVTTQTITVLVNGDTKFEPPTEAFFIDLNNATGGATFTDANANGNITNDDPIPTVSINDATVAEGNAGTTAFTFTVTLTNPSSQAITIPYTTNDGTATVADGDYVDNDGSITFAPNTTTQTITVLVNGDTKFEANETFTVTLNPGVGALAGDTSGLGTIVNDDTQPTISIADVTLAEGNAGTTAFTFTVTLNNASANAITVDFTTRDSSATVADGDYVANAGTLTFAPGVTTQTITVLVNGDTKFEANEIFFIDLNNATGGATFTDANANGNITNDDAQPMASVSDVTLTEGNAGTTNAVFTVTLTNPSSQPITVAFTTVDGTATAADGDYATTAGTLTFAPGQTTMTISVPVNGDTKFESNESFTVVLSSPTNATLADGTGLGTITNDDAQPTASIGDVTMVEGNAGTTAFTFTVTLTNASDTPITVAFTTRDSSATVADGDYVANAGTLTFAPGVTTQTITVLVNGDTKFEPNESFFIDLSNATGGATFTDANADGIITNDDVQPTISINDVSMAEGNAGTTNAVFTVTLSNPSSQAITVAFTTVDGTATAADGDYATTAGTLTFAPGTTTQTISVPVNGDTKFEATEMFTVVLSSPTNATLADGTGLGTITNDDAQPTASIGDVTMVEGNAGTTAFTFTVTLSNGSQTPITVDFATQDGTATVPLSDYTANAGTLTFANGVTTQTITVLVNGDLKHEPNEAFFVNLSNPVGTTFTDAQGQGSIQNDDPIPVVSIDDITVIEGNAGTTNAVFTVTLANPSDQTITVTYTTNDGTATVADGDYVDNDGSITFAPGETTKTITVLINGDTKFEATELITVTLTSVPLGAVFGPDTTGTGAITNDDAQPTASIGDVTVVEGNAGTTAFTFTVTLTNASENPITVDFATQDGSATVADLDYVANAGTLTFAPGQTTQTITVLVNGDTKFESNEQFQVVLSNATGGATFTDANAIGIITNDDAQPTASVSDVTLTEGNAGTTNAVFTVTLTNASSQPITVAFTTVDGTATAADGDYASTAGTLTFAPGQTTMTISVPVNGDTKFESNESFTVVLSAPTNATLADGTGLGTITNDDAQPTASIGNVTRVEGNGGTTAFTFTVTLSNASQTPIIVDFATRDSSATVADGDYVANAGTLTFAPGVTTQTITVLVNGDTKFEANETFFIDLSNATGGATFADANADGTITNDDAQPTASISDVTRVEGNGGTTAFTFTVTLSNGSQTPITVDFATQNGTATTADGDYVANTGTLTFANGVTTQTITVLVNGDTKFESNESFTVVLSSPTNATLADGNAIGTITNDDAQPTASIGNVTRVEGNGGTTAFTFTVTLSNASQTPITVDFATQNGTATTADGDYVANTGTLTFANGVTTQTITVLVNGDTKFESNEQFFVNLSNPVGTTFTDANAIGTITNDDAQPTVSVSDVTRVEGNGGTTNAVFTVTLSNASSQPITVAFTTVDGTATAADGDYASTAGTLTFAPGQTTMTISVLVNGDTKFESNESFTVVLSAPTNATLADGTGLGTITNDDAQPTASIGNVTRVEGNDGTTAFTFTVTLSNGSQTPITVDFATQNGTATVADGDYVANTGTLTFAPNTLTQTITVLVNGDTKFEANEQFFVNLNSATIANNTGAGTITNDDTPPVLTGFSQFAAGADVGGSTVKLFNADLSERFTNAPFPGFTGGIRTAAADFNGDGVADLVVGTGPGRATQVRILDGVSQAELFSITPFEASFTGGVYVSAGDVTGDGIPDLAITPDEGGGPRVDIYSGAVGFPKIASFFGIDDTNFRGGARSAIGDMTGDGVADLIVVAGFGGGPRVAAFDGKSLSGTPVKLFGDFFAFEQTLRNGIFVTAGDINGDGFADLIAGGGPGGGPRVQVFDGKSLLTNTQVPLANFFAGDINSRGGIRLAVKNFDGDTKADLVVGSGSGAGSRVTGYLGKNIAVSGTPTELFDFDVFDGFSGGVFVG